VADALGRARNLPVGGGGDAAADRGTAAPVAGNEVGQVVSASSKPEKGRGPLQSVQAGCFPTKTQECNRLKGSNQVAIVAEAASACMGSASIKVSHETNLQRRLQRYLTETVFHRLEFPAYHIRLTCR
jgi:hypothetical protein